MAKENEGGSFVIGFALGAVIGAGLALVFAPRSGEETREQLRQRSEELRTLGEEAKAKVQKAIEEGIPKVQKVIEEGRAEATKAREELMSRFRETQETS
jgi:gas vesicle protein